MPVRKRLARTGEDGSQTSNLAEIDLPSCLLQDPGQQTRLVLAVRGTTTGCGAVVSLFVLDTKCRWFESTHPDGSVSEMGSHLTVNQETRDRNPYTTPVCIAQRKSAGPSSQRSGFRNSLQAREARLSCVIASPTRVPGPVWSTSVRVTRRVLNPEFGFRVSSGLRGLVPSQTL